MINYNILSLLIVLLFVALCWLFRHRYKFDSLIKYSAIIVYLMGVVVYFIGFREGPESLGTRQSWLASLFRPLVSAIEMFFSSSDLIEVGEGCKNNMIYMTCFSTIHFAAITITMAVAISYLGVRFQSMLQWRRLSRSHVLKGNLHVFFGVTKNGLRLAQDFRHANPQDVVIFIFAPEARAKDGELALGSIFNFFGLKREVISKVSNIGAIIHPISAPIQELRTDEVLAHLGLHSLIEKTQGFVGFYCLDSDTVLNINKTIKLRHDPYFENRHSTPCYLYCQASAEALASDIAFEANSAKGIETITMNGGKLTTQSILTLQKQDSLGHDIPYQYQSHPVNFVDIDPEQGVATTPFHCMILGFDEPGQSVARFLFEYGQFEFAPNIKGTKFVCHIVDPHCDDKRGRFLMKNPALNSNSHLSPIDFDIQWHNFAPNSSHFWEFLAHEIDNLNYIALTTGEDNLNLTLSYDLFDYAVRRRTVGLHNFGIFPRNYKGGNESRYLDIANTCRDASGRQYVFPFGLKSQTLCHERIWRQCIEHDAALFSEALRHSFQGESFSQIPQSDPDLALSHWNDRHYQSKESQLRYAENNRIEYQEYSAFYHIYTKMHLLALDDPNSSAGQHNRDLLRQCQSLDDLLRLPFFDHLVRQEHMRWVASHLSEGYVPMTLEDYQSRPAAVYSDPIHRKQLTLVPWSQLGTLPCPEQQRQSVPQPYRDRPYEYLFLQAVATSLSIALSHLES